MSTQVSGSPGYYQFYEPSTRYQGSKHKMADWIWENVSGLQFDRFLDLMGGSGIVGFICKKYGREVTYNDNLRSNYYQGLALIENESTVLSEDEVSYLLNYHNNVNYDTFIQDTFKDIYYLDEENRWLDMVACNIKQFDNIYKKALALSSLFQSCIIKRPYNLFHRKNLYMRLAKVKRGFGNKTTWDTSFENHFRRFISEFNSCVFSNKKNNRAFNIDILETQEGFTTDLVYIDPPYFSSIRGPVDYLQYYHFLEGLCLYVDKGSEFWLEQIDFSRKPRPFKHAKSSWLEKHKVESAFQEVIKRYSSKIIVISYNSEGIPNEETIRNMLEKYNKDVEIKRKKYQYALSKNQPEELLFIAT